MDIQTTDPAELAPDTYQKFMAISPEEEAEDCATMVEVNQDYDPASAFYDTISKEFLLRNKRGVWIALNEGSFKKHLRGVGVSTKPREGQHVSDADAIILNCQNDRDVDYCGQLSGRDEGFYVDGKVRMLITRSIKLAEPAKGAFPLIRALVDGLLGSDVHYGETQKAVYYAWLKLSLTSLISRIHQPAQALAIAGSTGCGKSLLQALTTEVFGGRSARGHRYMSGATTFNADLFEAEHIMLEDEYMSRKISDRLALGSSIKQFCVNRRHSCHAKGRKAVDLSPWWRVSISLNDDPEALVTLPPLDTHIEDKIVLLRAHKFTFPMPMSSAAEQTKFMEAMKEEIPHLIHWLLNEFEIPGPLADPQRYGVISWKHPVLRAELDGLSPEAELLSMIDECLWTDLKREWKGTTEDLMKELFNDHSVGPRARKLLEYRTACGTYLGRLAAKADPRVINARTNNKREFIITAPNARS